MRTPVDDQLREEARSFSLRFSCEHCVHFVAERAACANGYPTQAHLVAQLEQREDLYFCKEFELV